MPGISLRDITKSYHDADRELTVIEGLTFDFPETGTVAIVGKSGVGKSTLLHIIGGLDTPSRGEVFIDDIEIGGLDPDARSKFRGERLGFIFQSHHLLGEFSATENVAMPLIIAGLPQAEAFDKANNVLDRVGLIDRLHHRPSALSGGEQQRVAIARAVVSKPRVILADEPTGNLDPATASQVQGLLREVQQEQQNLMIVVTHNSDLAKSMDIMLELLPGGRLVRV